MNIKMSLTAPTRAFALSLAAGFITILAGHAQAGPIPVEVFTDPAGDADLEQGLGVGQGLGQSLPGGWDLVGGTIARSGPQLDFTVTHADMPSFGSGPEATRFLWSFAVDGKPYRLTIKSADIGKPDVVAGQTSERVGRIDLDGHFRLEGACEVTPTGSVNCPPLEYLDGSFDPAAMSFTVHVPLKSIKAKTGSSIGRGNNHLCGAEICWISHVAERSSGATVIDAANQLVTYKIPRR